MVCTEYFITLQNILWRIAFLYKAMSWQKVCKDRHMHELACELIITEPQALRERVNSY